MSRAHARARARHAGYTGGVHGRLRSRPHPHPRPKQAGYTGKVKIGMDVAAAEFFVKDDQKYGNPQAENGKYDLDFKTEGAP